MTKADIVDRITKRCGLTKKKSKYLLESVLSIMKNTLEAGEDLKIYGFGKFMVKEKEARCGWNPKTGKTKMLEARRVLIFKTSRALKATINVE